MISAIQTFKWFTIQWENWGVCTVADLKTIVAQDFLILLDDMSAGAQVKDGTDQGNAEAFIVPPKSCHVNNNP
jgi:hypothetical protein